MLFCASNGLSSHFYANGGPTHAPRIDNGTCSPLLSAVFRPPGRWLSNQRMRNRLIFCPQPQTTLWKVVLLVETEEVISTQTRISRSVIHLLGRTRSLRRSNGSDNMLPHPDRWHDFTPTGMRYVLSACTKLALNRLRVDDRTSLRRPRWCWVALVVSVAGFHPSSRIFSLLGPPHEWPALPAPDDR